MNDNRDQNVGKQIEETVRTAMESGDLSHLKNIGPVVQKAVKENLRGPGGQAPYAGSQRAYPPPKHTYPPPQQPRQQGGHPYMQQQQQPPRQQPPQQARQVRVPPRVQQMQQRQAQQPKPYNPGNGQPPAAQPAWMGGALRVSQPRSGYGVGSVVLGVMGMVAFGIASIFLGAGALLATGTIFIGGAATSGVGFLLSGGLLGGGMTKRALSKRVRRYLSFFNTRDVVTIAEMSRSTGRSEKAILKDLRKAMDKGLLRDMKLDVHETCLIRGNEAYQLYIETEQARKEREEREAELQKRMADPALAPIEVFKAEGTSMINKIREANNAIPGEEISLKLDKLENTTSRIVSCVESHPEKLPDTRKFMNYYLPTTLKLVEKYRQYDSMDIQMDNVTQTKNDIEKSLDSINVAFTNLLQSLYHEDTLDVSTDIEVLQTMLEQEGLMGNKFDIEGQA